MTWTAFKRLAQLRIDQGTPLSLALKFRFGASEGTPEWDKVRPSLKGERRILKVSSGALHLELCNEEQEETSELHIERAALVAISGTELIVYKAGIRALTPAEAALEAKWSEVHNTADYQRQLEIDCKLDSNSCYWKRLDFYHGMEYLLGSVEQHGCRATYQHDGDRNTKMVVDKNVPGAEILRYNIIGLK